MTDESADDEMSLKTLGGFWTTRWGAPPHRKAAPILSRETLNSSKEQWCRA